jgi:hypothetical protein
MFTVETVSQIKASAGGFDSRLNFARSIRSIIDTEYDGVKMTEAGGLIRSDEAVEIDDRITAVIQQAGYSATDGYELACEIWSAK